MISDSWMRITSAVRADGASRPSSERARSRGAGLLLAMAVASLVALAGGPALSQVVPQADPLAGRVLAPAGFVATPVPRPLAEVRNELSAAVLADISAFQTEAGQGWRFYIDRRSGGAALVEGQGLPWLPGAGNSLDPATVHGSGLGGAFTLQDLEQKARAFISRYPGLFRVPASQLVLDARGSSNFGEHKQFWSLAFRQVFGGVPVEHSRVVFRVSHGNLVQFGVNRILPPGLATAAPPSLTVADAKAALGTYLGGLRTDDLFSENGALLWVLRGTADEVGYTGPLGAGWQPSLVYAFTFNRTGSPAEWRVLVDALTGQVLRFVDSTEYAAVLAKGSVLVNHNCADPSNCVPGTASELPVAMPDLRLQFTGGSCSGNACYTNSGGAYEYPAGALSATSTLEGKYFQVVDTCGPVAVSGLAPGGLDFGTSDPLGNLNTDCFPASRESAPGSNPAFGGTGDTHSARALYYHLNLINQKSRFYLPNNAWLQASAGPTLVLSNLPPACNAFWFGSTQTLNFMRQTPGLGCNNTGEVPPVFLHEFGHGLDDNDGTGTAPESATGEAMGDTFALLQGQEACFGSGFRLANVLDPTWGTAAGYGSATVGSNSRLCTGVRELDYTKLCNHGDGADCIPARDPDAPNGSRSGLNPPPEPVADAGTPARWNTMDHVTPEGAADGRSNFYNCGGPETDGCAGPLNHGCHCESSIASQTNWDLVKRLVSSEFGGSVYNRPQGPKEVSGWQYMDRLWYLTRDLAVSGYSATGPFPDGMTNGCTATDWFSTYRFVDDDNGNLADGTPHADSLFAAFDLHGTACGAAADPSNQRTGCPAPMAAPVVSTCGGDAPVQLAWTAPAGVTRFRVLRNTLGCGFGFTPVAEIGGSRTYFEDAEAAPGVTYYYSVQPVGANESCYGFASNCVAVTPSSCSGAPLPAPTGVALSTPAANRVNVTWNAVPGAGSYKILRKAGGCSSSAPEQTVGVVQAPATSFLDGDRLEAESTYSYRVAASGASCASCASAPSSCQSVAPTGVCTRTPGFAGVQKVSASTNGDCKLTVSWSPATPSCSGTVTYSVYRSTDPAFQPGPGNLVASGLTGTRYDDASVVNGTRYFYLVRATDGAGNTETNTVRRWEIPAGKLTPGTFTDDAGDTRAPQLFTTSGSWSVRTSGLNNATRHYATSADGNYPSNSCAGLESRTLYLGANPTLTFRSRYDLERGWDGGYVEVSTEDGGFSNWTKLQNVNYPGIMASPLGDPACGGPGFADGQPVFTGTSLLDNWGTFSASLSTYANQHVRLRFKFGSDSSTEQGGWFVDDVQVTDVMLPGPCASSRVCGTIDDTSAAIDYRGGMIERSDPGASGGTYHLRRGGKSVQAGGQKPAARVVFQGDGITYFYATSAEGGTVEVYLDGVLRDTFSQAGPTITPAFGAKKTYTGLGSGAHEIMIVNRGGTTYVDGFELICKTAGDGADPTAVQYGPVQQSGSSNLAAGGVLEQTLQIGSSDQEVFVMVEGGSLPLTLQLLSPSGGLLATGAQLLSGLSATGLDAVVTTPGTYKVRVLNPLGGLATRVTVTTARTVAYQ
jgi:fibronectin type 3 domain-containing protein